MSDDLTVRLKAWGNATVARLARQHDGPSNGDSVLTKNADIFPGRKPPSVVEKALMVRSGIARRQRMAQAANAGLKHGVGMSIAPMWSCDPVPPKNDAGRPKELTKGWVDIGLPDVLLAIDSGVRALERQPNGKLRAMIVREEYTGVGTQKMKAARVAKEYGGKLTRKQYQRELYKAQEFLRGRIGS